MQLRHLASFRYALLASLGLLHACGSSDQNNSSTSQDGVGETTGDGPSNETTSSSDPAEGPSPAQPGGVGGNEPPGDNETSETPGVEPPPSDTPAVPMPPADRSPVEVTDPPEPNPPSPGPTLAPLEPSNAPEPSVDGGVAPEPPVMDGGIEPPRGVTTRPVPATCSSELPRDRVLEPDSENYQCTSDAECTDAEHGYCNDWVGQAGSGSNCNYGCVEDGDCAAGTVCDCGTIIGTCVPADCQVDADCGANSVCARYEYDDGCGLRIGYACTTSSDQCLINSDCAMDMCAPGQNGRECSTAICAIGRPFLIDGDERLAASVLRGDWLDVVTVDTTRLSADQRAQLGERWQRIALMEHASVAAFARFALQLLSVAAPPELLEATTRAMQDETEHARLAFGLASAYQGRKLGPSGLDIERSLGCDTLRLIVENTLLEGCIGETVAALEAALGVGAVRDPAVRAVLAKIAKDEQRHAELAWRFVRWALSQEPELGTMVLRRAEAEHDAARSSAVAVSQEPEADWLLRQGLLPESRRALLRAQVLGDVVLPSLRTLLASVEQERSSELDRTAA